MIIKTAEFLTSNTDYKKCPEEDFPEYAFIGRSNVGKSSLINMLTNHAKLAKISSTPGKTQLINHFLINGDWYLVDLPGYGYAKISKKIKETFENMIRSYLRNREQLSCLFMLVDSRLKPQKSDMEFMEFLGKEGVPFVIVFTKADKLSSSEMIKNQKAFRNEMLKQWEFMPRLFISSATSGLGKEEILGFIEETSKVFFENR